MKHYLHCNILAFIFTISTQVMYAQLFPISNVKRQTTDLRSDTVSLQAIPDKQKSHFETGISYQSNDVYFGRKDSSALPYFIPVLSYYHASGIYFSISANYLSDPEARRVDAVTLEGGYIFHTGKYDGQLNISKFIYNTQSTSVSSEIKASAGYQNGYDFGFMKTFINGSLEFGSRTDISASFGLEHGFSALNEKMEFIPSFCVNGGTQNFYDNYYKNKRYSNKGKGKSNGNTGTFVTGSVVNPSEFKILDYEASIPFSYHIRKMDILFTPTYAIPVNPSLIEVNTKQSNGNASIQYVTEHLSNSFFMTVGVAFKFG